LTIGGCMPRPFDPEIGGKHDRRSHPVVETFGILGFGVLE
jgi:hypothetical protein